MRSETVPSFFGEIVCGLYDIFKLRPLCTSLSIPAKILTNVVLPVPFSPNKTVISEVVKDPLVMLSSNPGNVFFKLGYWN